MSAFEGVLIFGGCGLIIILPIVAIAGVYYLGRRNKRNFQSLIEMDGARCVQAMDGRVTIKSKIWVNFFAFIFLIVTFGMCGWLVADNLSQDLSIIGPIVLLGFLALTIVPAIIYLWRGLRRPAFYFNPEDQTLAIKQGPSSRQIPFGQIAKLSVEGWQKEMDGQNFLPCAGIKLELTNGETIELGTLSSATGEKDLWKRCGDICHVVADVTGASLPSELQSSNP
jgi:hypothetical protein